MPKRVAALLLATAYLVCAAPAASLDRIRVGLSSISATSGSLWVAEEKGLFRKHGIEPELIVIGGGGARVVASLLAGEIQFSVGGGDAVVRTALKGADTVLVASPLKTGLQRMMARPDIRSPAELRGKRIGITRFGSASHWVLQLMLRRWGMRADEVQIIQLGSSPAMLASLDKGGVDAAVMTLPSFFVAEERGHRVLADAGDMEVHYLQNSLDTTRAYLRRNRDQSVRFAKGLIEGIAYFKKNRRESIEVLRKKLRIQSEQERELRHLESSYQLLAAKYYQPVPYPSPKAVATVLEFIAADDPKAKSADPRAFIEESIVREIDASGFIKALYEN
jgi:ABC-type nitrate/sulfonate/bicarbonate transport system substrate-binding protein